MNETSMTLIKQLGRTSVAIQGSTLPIVRISETDNSTDNDGNRGSSRNGKETKVGKRFGKYYLPIEKWQP